MINKTELKPNYSLFGGKGDVWSNTAHIYESGKGNLCGKPALSTNWVRIEEIEVAGCEHCIKLYKEQNNLIEQD
jgi:hypothetical protein